MVFLAGVSRMRSCPDLRETCLSAIPKTAQHHDLKRGKDVLYAIKVFWDVGERERAFGAARVRHRPLHLPGDLPMTSILIPSSRVRSLMDFAAPHEFFTNAPDLRLIVASREESRSRSTA